MWQTKVKCSGIQLERERTLLNCCSPHKKTSVSFVPFVWYPRRLNSKYLKVLGGLVINGYAITRPSITASMAYLDRFLTKKSSEMKTGECFNSVNKGTHQKLLTLLLWTALFNWNYSNSRIPRQFYFSQGYLESPLISQRLYSDT